MAQAGNGQRVGEEVGLGVRVRRGQGADHAAYATQAATTTTIVTTTLNGNCSAQ